MKTFKQYITEVSDHKKPLRTGLIPYYIDENNKIWVAVMVPSNPKYGGDWPQFAKGRLENGMTKIQNAINEATEELGYIHKDYYDVKLLSENDKDRIVWYYVKVDDTKLNKPHYESKEAYWIRTKELKDKIIKWQLPVLKLLKQMIKMEENTQKIVSFDFDDTIGFTYWDSEQNDFKRDDKGEIFQTPNEKIINIIRDTINKGNKAILVTSRKEIWKQDVLDKLKKWNVPIDPSDVYCTNLQYKYKTLKKLGVSKHYDDSIEEIKRLKYVGIKGVLVKKNENI